MDALKRFEDIVEGMVEGSLAAAMTSRLQPVEIAKKLARAMENGQTIAADRTLVPNVYSVMLGPADFASFAPFRQSLERELARYLRALAQEKGFAFIAAPGVAFVENSQLRPRRVLVSATISDVATARATVAQSTAEIPVAEVRAQITRPASLELADGRMIPLDKPVVSLGRGLDNDVVLEDRRVSRHHAQIRVTQGAASLFDLASANGTQVNGQAVHEIVLHDGDRISLGGVQIAFTRNDVEKKRGA